MDFSVKLSVKHQLRAMVISILLAVVLAGVVLIILEPSVARASIVPTGFRDTVVFQGLQNPTNVEFAENGQVFVTQKNGTIRVFDGLDDATPTAFANLTTNVFHFWDRGLLGLALDPDYPAKPYVYILYAHDAPIGGTAPRWGTPGVPADSCPTPPGATADGCVISGRLSRLTADVQPGNTVMTGTEKVLIEDWCQQYPSHSVGNLAFGSDGALYVSGGDGASFNFADYGQGGGSSGSPTPKNPCGDPPGGIGGNQTSPSAEGGALRSQDVRTGGDPAGLDGAILRVDPDTGDRSRVSEPFPLYG
jgi:glucose/arabinose dehydrogenase